MAKREVIAVLAGDANTGKTCLARRIKQDVFEDVPATACPTCFTADIVVQDSKDSVRISVPLRIWDTPGAVDYKEIRKMYMKNMDAIILTYSVDCEGSLESLEKHLEDARHESPNCAVFIVRCKNDWNSEDRCKLDEAGEELANRLNAAHGNVTFVSTSSKTRENIDELFIGIAQLQRPEEVAEAPVDLKRDEPTKQMGKKKGC